MKFTQRLLVEVDIWNNTPKTSIGKSKVWNGVTANTLNIVWDNIVEKTNESCKN